MTDLEKKIVELADGERSSKEIAEAVGASPGHVRSVMKKFGCKRLSRGARKGENNPRYSIGPQPRAQKVLELCNGEKTSTEIAEILGETKKYVQNCVYKYGGKLAKHKVGLQGEKLGKVLELASKAIPSTEIAKIVKLNPRHVRKVLKKHGGNLVKEGAQKGEKNHQFVSGRRITRHGYVLVTAPEGHPYARKRKGRDSKVIFEHRLILEEKLGRYLDPNEVVHHIDGLTLHNHPANLEVIPDLGSHTKLHAEHHQLEGCKRIPNFRQRLANGDVRLRAILLAALQLGIDSPYLLGSFRFLEQRGIDPYSRPELEYALREIENRYA